MFFSKKNQDVYLVAGLGNIGLKYENTRHNVGFMAITYVANKLGIEFNKKKFSSSVAETKIGNKRLVLIKPETYMNNSGEAVVAAMNFYKIPIENVIVISDDISLDVGKIRIRRNGSHGGQNGLRSIEELTGSQNYPRVKVGIGGKPNPNMDLADWVLSKFSKEDIDIISKRFQDIYDSVMLITEGNFEKAMNRYN